MEIAFDLTDGLARIAFDDGKMNAMNLVALAELAEVMDEAEAKAEALLLVGRPGSPSPWRRDPHVHHRQEHQLHQCVHRQVHVLRLPARRQ